MVEGKTSSIRGNLIQGITVWLGQQINNDAAGDSKSNLNGTY